MAVVDIELAHEVESTPHSRRIGILVGVAAIVAALLGVLQMDASTDESRAGARAARLSAELTRDITVNGLVSSFELPTQQKVFAEGIEAHGRALAALQAGVGEDVAVAAAEAETAAGERLVAIIQAMAAPPGPESGVDDRTRDALARDLENLNQLATAQGEQVDLFERSGKRGDRAVLGLSLAAVGAVLLGLAGIVGPGRAGTIVLWAAGVGLALAALTGASALLI